MKLVALIRHVPRVLVGMGIIALLIISPIFMIPVQQKLNRQVRPNSHLLAVQSFAVLVMQAALVIVVGEMGILEIALIALIATQALGIIAFLRAPSAEFETRIKDEIIISEWYKDSLWQGFMEGEVEELKERIIQIENQLK